MPVPIALADLAVGPTAWMYEGRSRGAEISFFVTSTPPGLGPGLHVHPYAETFLVWEGEGTFTVGDEQVVVPSGNIVVVPPDTPHGFKNHGEVTLRVIGIHDNGEVQQTWLEDD
jgi:mannose-6-phosphate isomerase-like protein (cupin superfamily)